jgi:transcriptional regulator with XRE-family HTH domain
MSETDRFGQLLRRRREALDMTQSDLARKLGVEASYIAFIERGRRKPSLRLVAKIADVIGLDRQRAFVLAHPEARNSSTEQLLSQRRRLLHHGSDFCGTGSYCNVLT